jgi:hypothetical protein
MRVVGLLAAIVLPGCSDPTVGVVSGTITIDGAAVKSGSIAFFPIDGKSPTSGAEIVEGRYSVTVAPGTASVEIRVPKVIGQKKLYDAPNSPVKEVMTELLPAKYNDASELTLDVKPGKNQKDFPLTTQ